MEIKFKKLNQAAQIPSYQSKGASGFDFHSVEDVILHPGQVHLVSTGLSVEMPEGYELQVRARSGLAAKKGVFLVNGIGTIDSDYRGEIKIILSTCQRSPVELKAGERVAQGVVMKIEQAAIAESAELSETLRGVGGFGSTGVA
ncbi:MAG: dUTP diphosphatase [Deltaproteobacteria bacterium CG11_big_fil_rev_8_21_14_0_20_45_16]|nr:MAG: dUTP diphosphatase [Deltaproteobacteria bacterium CG11_big_fil_rev_8_21_14_0_20_45_16]